MPVSDSDSNQYSQDSDFDSVSGEIPTCKGECKEDDDDSHLSFSSEALLSLNDTTKSFNSERYRSKIIPQHKERRISNASQLSNRKHGCFVSRLLELAKPRTALALPKPPPMRKKKSAKVIQEFVLRQEALEKLRQTKRVHKKLELGYESKVGKKKCRTCKANQPFAEFYGNKNICQCGTKYDFPSIFNLQRFERRMFESRCKRQQKIDEISEERLFILHKPPKSRHQQALMEKAAVRANGGDFLKRMCEDLAKRKQHLEALRRGQAEDYRQRKLVLAKKRVYHRSIECA